MSAFELEEMYWDYIEENNTHITKEEFLIILEAME